VRPGAGCCCWVWLGAPRCGVLLLWVRLHMGRHRPCGCGPPAAILLATDHTGHASPMHAHQSDCTPHQLAAAGQLPRSCPSPLLMVPQAVNAKHPSYEDLCDPTSPDFAATHLLLGPDNATVVDDTSSLWDGQQGGMWQRLLEGSTSSLCEVLGRWAPRDACGQGGGVIVGVCPLPFTSSRRVAWLSRRRREQRLWLRNVLRASSAPLILVGSGSVVAGGLGYSEGAPPKTCSGDDWLCYSRAQVSGRRRCWQRQAWRGLLQQQRPGERPAALLAAAGMEASTQLTTACCVSCCFLTQTVCVSDRRGRALQRGVSGWRCCRSIWCTLWRARPRAA
jgi:hypothetical protein